ncbi:MAG TPA: RNA polymerase sigma factor [Bryobacteraceae bacterium]|nr:RNA polymerase sigma factor [Bryobacteraceae bacterium]
MTPNGPESDEDLLLRMRSGDEQAFLTLYRKRQGAIYRFALHMSGSPAAAEDVTQEVFLALIREECGYDPERGTLSSYLFGIARNLVLRNLERDRSDVPLDSEPDSFLPELAIAADALVDLTRKEGLEALRRAVLSLPRRYREVVILCDLQEMDYTEAASVVGCPIGTVRSRLHRARLLLLEKLNHGSSADPAVRALRPARCLL